jgi:hypothetical protein
MGDYRMRLARRDRPGDPLVSLGEVVVHGVGPHELAGSENGEVVPSGSVYEVALVDPIGRTSDPATGVVP